MSQEISLIEIDLVKGDIVGSMIIGKVWIILTRDSDNRKESLRKIQKNGQDLTMKSIQKTIIVNWKRHSVG